MKDKHMFPSCLTIELSVKQFIIQQVNWISLHPVQVMQNIASAG